VFFLWSDSQVPTTKLSGDQVSGKGSRGFSSFGSRGLNRNIDVQRESMYDVSEGVCARNCVFRSMLRRRVSVCPDPKTQAAQISCTMCVCGGNRVSRRGCLTGMHQGEVSGCAAQQNGHAGDIKGEAEALRNPDPGSQQSTRYCTR
jgi:hypothetical protein